MSGGWGPPSYYRGGPYGQPPPRPTYRWAVIAVVVALIVAALLILLYVAYWAPAGPTGPGYPGRFGLFGGVFFLFFVLILIFFIVRVAFWGSRAGMYRYARRWDAGPGYGPDRAAAVARMRYARGEISRAQYDQIMTDLERRRGVG